MLKKQKSEVHLFIVWEHARIAEEKIVEDLQKKFKIVKSFEVHWSKANFSKNLSRFYGTQLPPNSRKETHVGINPFLAIVVEDKQPKYVSHTTSKGDKLVNTNLFTSKALHREWTGGGHKIHATNTVEEADHNLTMLFGLNSTDFRKKYKNTKSSLDIEIWDKDLVGSDGWKDLSQLFYTLNNTINYLVMRNFEALPNGYYSEEHGDIDLLVSSYKDACFLTNSKPVFKSSKRAYNKVNIGGKNILFDFRSIGDNYYDEQWEKDMLRDRTLLKKGFYIPSSEDYYYSLLYHALIHKPHVSSEYISKLTKLSQDFSSQLTKKSFTSLESIKELSSFMTRRSYSFTQPNDKSVYINLVVVNQGKSSNVPFKRRKIIPLRNYLKSKNIPLKHYYIKLRKIVRRKIRGIDTSQ